jgi:uncharacterized membrane protein YcjF (UPF0283 family)
MEESESYSGEESSTPTLESIYQNFRILKHQRTSTCKRGLGVIILLACHLVILAAHGWLLKDIKTKNFYEWISCTMFAFMVMIFGLDSVLYIIVSWVLKRTSAVYDKRHCCSVFYVMVILPLGKHKY